MVTVLKKGTSKKQLSQIVKKMLEAINQKGFNAYAYCGKIRLEKDAILIQKELRDEWN